MNDPSKGFTRWMDVCSAMRERGVYLDEDGELVRVLLAWKDSEVERLTDGLAHETGARHSPYPRSDGDEGGQYGDPR